MTQAVLDNTKIAITAGIITVYNFSALTGEFTGSSDEYLAVGVGIPAYSTDIDPGESEAGYVAVFTESGWQQEEDHRGENVYSTTDHSVSVIDYIGAIKDGFTSAVPASAYDIWNGSTWVTDAAAQHVADVTAAELHAQQLVDAAMSSISVIQLKLQAGRALTNAETTKLNTTLDYIDAVNAVDKSSAPDVSWPEAPEALAS
ncbi:TPA: tail fiber assembly protein [Enterobacter kobei]|uniref:tail fiber assembly protein n=1 Tax=Enterobacter kobei TaxID=208224 RepID=UPI00277C8545|nr:tail fiber assembly protein [Enterobacter kobei]